VEAAAKTVHQKSGGKVAGVTLRGLQGIHSVYVWAGWLWGFGGEFVDSNGKSAIASPQAQSALEAYARLLREYGPKGFTKNAWTENRNLFIQGKAAMTLDATVNGAFNEDPQISNVVGKVGYVPVPVQAGIKAKGGSGSLAAHSLYVSAESKKKEAAWLFMSWATSKDQQIKSLALAPNSGVTSMAAMASKEFTSRYGAFKDAMVASINQGNPQYLPTVGAANEIINSTGVAVSKVLNGRASAKVALEVADKANAIALSR
jgi:ABC-type glycerol-3-phosphate transport system substrate-binding protein